MGTTCPPGLDATRQIGQQKGGRTRVCLDQENSVTASGGFEEQVSDRFLRLLASTRESSEREVGEKEEWWRAGDGRAVSTHVTGVSEAGARRNSGPAKIVRSSFCTRRLREHCCLWKSAIWIGFDADVDIAVLCRD